MKRLLPLLLLLSLSPLAPATAADPASGCGASPGGAPCDGSGPASQGNGSATNQGAGNPINLTNGNKYQQEIDLPPLPGILGLEIIRHYNSAYAGPNAPNGILGRGWKLSYETELYAIGNSLQIIQADGTRLIFSRTPTQPHVCASNDPSHGRIHIRKTPRGDEYTWTWPNGRRLEFDRHGKLVQILAPGGEFVSLQHDAQGLLVKVTDPQGRELRLNYLDRKQVQVGDRFRGVQSIDSPVGRYSYAYGSEAPTGASGNPRERLANLVKVSLPTHHEAEQKAHAYANHGITSSSISRIYHYEDPRHPTLLTGITVSGIGSDGQLLNQRTGTYQYDEQGRGIQSVKGQPRQSGPSAAPGTGIEQVDLHYDQPALPQGQPGKTMLTNSLGQTTTYTHVLINEQARLLEVRGPGCASCGESNVRYAYDKLGRQTDKTQLTPQGQPIHTTRTERDAQGRPTRISSISYVNGPSTSAGQAKAQPARLLVRYEYAGEGTQPTLIARPSVIPSQEHQIRIAYNAAGQVLSVTESGYRPALDGTPPTPISRTTTYTYRTINGRSLLAQIDGPLQNGKSNSPADSDITLIQYDGRGSFVAAMTTPGGFTSTVQYDEAGRIATVSNAHGFKTTFTYDARNQLTRVSSSGANWAQAGIEPVEQSWRHDALGNRVESGSGNGKTFRPQTRQAYDVAGRLLWQAEALGILKHASYDSEGHLLSSTVQTKRFEQTERYRYDEFNRLIEVADNTGSVRNVVYGKAPDPQRSRRQSAFQILRDDFGREVMVRSASHGTLVKRYDETDRLIEQRDGKGDRQAYAYDLSGQRIRHSVIPKTGETQTTTWRHAQGRLAEVKHPNQSERITYNERGQPLVKTVTLKLANGAEAVHITRYRYTADGSLASQSLPDGTKILYERNGQGQVVAVSRQTSPWTVSGWGKTTLVKDLERDLIGLAQVTYGNGIQGQWQRSREGVLARVVYSRPEGRAVKPSSVAAALNPHALGNILDALLPAAHAHTLPPQANKLPGALGLPANPQALFDARLLYDGAGNVLLQKQQGHGAQHTQAYAYDRQSQLIAAQSASPSSPVTATSTAGDARIWRYHYDKNGNRILAQENVPATEMGQTRKARYDPDSNALLTPPGLGREYVWNAQGQLIAIRQENRELARYSYNHHGLRVGKQVGAESTHTLYNDQRQRIADLDANGHITRQYIWLGDHLIATLDAKQPKVLRAPAEGFWQELTQTAQALWNSVAGPSERIAFVQVNYLGAPIAATDETAQILWQADYAPYGKVIKASAPASGKAAYTLALRLPGQWEDAESGLYYNDLRYYDPQAGRYLSPDPLGRIAERLGSPNAYIYVNNNPISYIDPWGLILFAFDGTGNTEDSRTNVYWFRETYLDNDPELASIGADRPYYIEGPGTGSILPTLDGGIAFTMRSRVNQQLKRLDDYVKAKVDNVLNVKGGEISPANPLVITLDIVGFSRGSASARDFANTVVARANNGYYRQLDGVNGGCVQVKLRFMGLFDTVLSYAVGSFNMGIPEAVEYVSQAVAVNEHRRDFPVESIEPSYADRGLSSNRTERGFVGAHSDIGGGYNCTGGASMGCDGGDLSDVALNWMVAEAKRAGVTMDILPADLQTITNPILHNETRSLPFKIWGTGQDREVRYPVASDAPNPLPKQRGAPIEGMIYTDSLTWITRDTNPTGSREGSVDMTAYGAWLNANYGINLQ